MMTHIGCSLSQCIFYLVILCATCSGCSTQSDPPVTEQFAERLRESLAGMERRAIYFKDAILKSEFERFKEILQTTTMDDLANPRLGIAYLNPSIYEDKALLEVNWIADKPQADAVRIANNEESIDLQISLKKQQALLQESVTVVVYATAFYPKHSSEQWANIDRITQSDDCHVILLKDGKEISEPHPIIRLSGDE